MAAGTSRFGWSERPADVATLTRHTLMRAVEHKAGAEVIKRLLRPGVARCKQTGNGCKNEQQAANARGMPPP